MHSCTETESIFKFAVFKMDSVVRLCINLYFSFISDITDSINKYIMSDECSAGDPKNQEKLYV